METPSWPIETPYSQSAASIVRFWWVITMNCARSAVAPQQRQEAIEVEIVERRLDLVEDVEGARAREEHREQERQRGHRLLAAGEQRQALGRLARGRDLDLHARQLLLLRAPATRPRSPPPRPPRSRRVALALRQRLAAEHRPRRLLVLDQPQAPGAAGEHVADQLLEVARGRREGLLEGLLDLAVGFADHRAQLAQRRLQVAALALELLDVRERLRVLLLGERVDRPELLAPARQSLHARAQRLRLLLAERLGARRRPAPPRPRRAASAAQTQSARRRLRSSSSASPALVAQPLGGDLGLGDRLAAPRAAPPGSRPPRRRTRAASPAISSPAWRSAASSCSSVATRARPPPRRRSRAPPPAARRAARAPCRRVLGAQPLDPAPAARRARARAARPGGARPRARPRARALRTASAPCAGAARRCSISHSLRRRASPASAWRRSASRSAPSAPTRASSAARSCRSACSHAPRAVCSACAAQLGVVEQPVAFVAPGQHPLAAALAQLAHLAPGGEPHAALARGGDARRSSSGRSSRRSTTHASASSRPASSSTAGGPLSSSSS